MPVYDFSSPTDRLALCLEQPDSPHRHALAYLVERAKGKKAKEQMIKDWKERKK